MKQDAFGDLGKEPFNYEEQLDFARGALKSKIADYIRRHPEKSYRDLGALFGLSVGALCGIVQSGGESRKVGRPSGRRSKPLRIVPKLSTLKIPGSASE